MCIFLECGVTFKTKLYFCVNKEGLNAHLNAQ